MQLKKGTARKHSSSIRAEDIAERLSAVAFTYRGNLMKITTKVLSGITVSCFLGGAAGAYADGHGGHGEAPPPGDMVATPMMAGEGPDPEDFIAALQDCGADFNTVKKAKSLAAQYQGEPPETVADGFMSELKGNIVGCLQSKGID